MKRKRLLSWVLTFAMIAGMFVVPASAEGDTTTITQENTSGTMTITLEIPETPAAPTATDANIGKNSITLTAVTGCEYSMDGESWQDSNEFSDLLPGKAYTFYQRVKATDSAVASAASEAATISTLADTYAMTITLVISGVKPQTLTYSGEPQELVKVETAADITPTYALGSNAENAPASGYGETIPTGTNAGSYYVWFKENDGAAKCVTATIAPKPVTVSGIKAQDKTYDGTTRATLNYDDLTLGGKLDADTLTVTATGTFADANVGEEKTVTINGITLGGAAKDNYTLAAEGQQATATASITPAKMQVTALDYTGAYDGKAHGISVLVLSPAGATVTYSTKDGDYTSTPIQKTDAGTTTVYYKVTKDGNYEEVKGSGTVTINPRDISHAVITFSESDVAEYTGSSVSAPAYTVTLDGTALASSAYEVSGNSGTAVGNYTLTLTGKGNYTGTATKAWKIASNPVTVSVLPTANAITYGQTLRDSTLTGGTASVAGTFAWADGTIVPDSVGSKTYDVVFTPTDSSYAAVTKSVTLTVNKATPQITTAPTASAITAGKTLGDSKLTGGVATAQYGTARVVGKFAWQDAASTEIASAGDVQKTVTFTPLDTTNYNNATTTVTLMVGRTAPTGLSITPATATYAYASGDSLPTFNGSETHSDGVTPVIYYSTRNFTAADVTDGSADVKAWSTVTATTALPVGSYYVAAYYADGTNTSAYLTAPAILAVTKGTREAPSAVQSVDTEKMTATLAEADRSKSLEYRVDSGNWTLVSANAGVFKLPALSAETHNIYLRERGNANYETTAASAAYNFNLTKVAVSYNANGGVGAPVIQTVTSGTQVEIAAAGSMTRAGYTFTGWNTAAAGNGTAYAAGNNLTVNSSMVLYAQWTPKSYSVAFHANASDAVGSMSNQGFTYDTAAQLNANTFTRTGYTFAGWAESASGAVMYTDKQTVKNLSADGGIVDLYAVWAQNTYSVLCDVTTDHNTPVTLTLKRGSTVVAAQNSITVTNGKAETSFTGVPKGLYNLVATQTVGTAPNTKDIVMTVVVNVTDSDVPADVTMPSGNANSTLEVAEDTRPVVVDGLAKEAEDKAQVSDPGTTTTVTIAMEVSKQEEQELTDSATEAQKDTQAAIEEIKAEAAKTAGSGDQTLEFMNIDVSKTVTTETGGGISTSAETTPITETSNVIELVIPFDMTGKDASKLMLYRHHDGSTAPLTKDNSRTDGHFHWLNGFIHLFTNKFSTYAISYAESTEPTPTPTPTPTPSSGGSSGSTITVPVSGDSASVSVSASVSGTTATVKAPTTAQLDKVIGESVKTGDVTIDVSGLNKNITTVNIPKETVKAIEKAVSDPDNDADALTVKLTDGSVTFDAKALAAVVDQAKGSTVQLNLDNIGESKLKTAQKTAIRDMDVQAVYDAYMTSNGQRISDFKGGKAAVTVSYTLKDGQTGRGVVVWYVADDGKTTEVPTAYNDKTVSFTVEHFSNYVIAYDAQRAAVCPKDDTCPISAFSDASATAWYHDGVHYVLESGIMNGVGNGKFGPSNATSRAMIAQILWNMEGKPVVNYALSYTDVDANAWYAEAVRWATAQGIMNGYGGADGGKFGPNDDMTREQLVTIMYRYAQMKKVDVSIGEDTNILSYDDAFDVSEWAIPAMQWAVGAEIVNGTSASTLSPKNNASRAEIATIVMRYCTGIAK